MSLREEVKSAAPGIESGPAFFSALKRTWKVISAKNQRQPVANLVFPGRDFGKHNYSTELHGVIDSIVLVRRRILTNTCLQGWMKWWTWILVGLMVAAAFRTKLAGVVILAAILVTIGALVIVVWNWRTRPSAYDAACRLDSVAGLYDRGSTALYFGAMENPGGMMLRQRRDAVTRLALVNPRALFPIRMPATTVRMLVLVLAVAGLFAYRMHHRPPMLALWQSAARSQLVQSMLSPLVHATVQDLRRTAAAMNLKPDLPVDEIRPDEATPAADDLWSPNDENETKVEEKEQQNSQDANFDEQQENQSSSQIPGDQGGMKSGDSQQQGGSQQSSEGHDNQGTSSNSRQQPGSQNSGQSLSQSLMQALKSMMSNSPGQQASNQMNNQPPPNPQPAQEGGNNAGDQPGNKGMQKNQPALPVKAAPDRVMLESNKFKEKTRVRAATETGTAQLPVRNVSPQAVAVINGAEQENIPARYRSYVEHYFEHADNKGQP